MIVWCNMKILPSKETNHKRLVILDFIKDYFQKYKITQIPFNDLVARLEYLNLKDNNELTQKEYISQKEDKKRILEEFEDAGVINIQPIEMDYDIDKQFPLLVLNRDKFWVGKHILKIDGFPKYRILKEYEEVNIIELQEGSYVNEIVFCVTKSLKLTFFDFKHKFADKFVVVQGNRFMEEYKKLEKEPPSVITQVKLPPKKLRKVTSFSVISNRQIVEVNKEKISFSPKKKLKFKVLSTKDFQIINLIYDIKKMSLKRDLRLSEIQKNVGCKSENAVRQGIKRINQKFYEKGYMVKIAIKNSKCLLEY